MTEPSFRRDHARRPAGLPPRGLPARWAGFYVGWRLAACRHGHRSAQPRHPSLVYLLRASRRSRRARSCGSRSPSSPCSATVGLARRTARPRTSATPDRRRTRVWALAFLGSDRGEAAARRRRWPAPGIRFRASSADDGDFKSVYGIESVVWGLDLLGRSALRLAVLAAGWHRRVRRRRVSHGPPATLGAPRVVDLVRDSPVLGGRRYSDGRRARHGQSWSLRRPAEAGRQSPRASGGRRGRRCGRRSRTSSRRRSRPARAAPRSG